jgi:hypothetical protein
MNCRECVELLHDYSLGILEPAVALGVSEHLDSGCLDCRAVLISIDIATSSLSQTLTPIAPPALVKTQLLEAIRKEKSEKDRTAESDFTVARSDETTCPPKTEIRLRSKESEKKNRNRVRHLVLVTAAGVAGAVFAYQATLYVQNDPDRRLLSKTYNSEAFQASVLARHQKSSSAVRFVSVPPPDIARDTSSRSPTGYVVFDTFAKQLHLAIDLKVLPKPGALIGCEAVDIEGVHQRLGEIKFDKDSATWSVFELPTGLSKIVKILVVEYVEKEHLDSTQKKILEMEIDLGEIESNDETKGK